MEPSERLAAYLADELPADERRALEADLARDTRLRADLEAMRRTDTRLAAETPTPLPDGARDRLLAALRPTFDERLADTDVADATPDDGTTADDEDELAARRRARGRAQTWLTAVGGVAAAVVAVAVVVPGLTGGGDDQADSDAAFTASDEAGEAGDELLGEAADPEAADDGAADDTAVQLDVVPRLDGGDRELDAAGADQLLAAAALDEVVDLALDRSDAGALRAQWAEAYGASVAAAEENGRNRPTSEAEPDADDLADARRELLDVGPEVDAVDRAVVARCLENLLQRDDPVVVPVTAELVVFDGTPAVAFGLVTRGPSGQLDQREVRVVDRDDCQVVYETGPR